VERIADEVLLSSLVDFLFKRMFGDEQHTDILIAFLNGIFEDAGMSRVTSVQLLNPYIDKDALTDKMSVLDIRARTEAKTLINIEIQIRNTGEMRERSLYYWSKLYESQLHESGTYRTLHPAVAINVLDFVEIPNDRGHNVFQIKNQDGAVLTDHLTAADRVGLRNRGLLLQFLDENHIEPVPDPTKSSERVREELDERMEVRLKRWQSQ
jgi:predicted transposase/invertase (TIGR01784 family)